MKVVADANIPFLDELLPPDVRLRRLPGRAIDRASLAGADALLVRSVTRVDRALVSGTTLRFVGTATAGIDHIDHVALRARGIAFAHAPGSNADSVAEYVLAAVMAVDDCWERLCSGSGTVGIVGFGAVGRSLAARLGALGIRFAAHDPWLEREAQAALVDDLEAVLACDVVTLHCALTDARPWPSRGLLCASTLHGLGDDALLINASRGAVVDERALLQVARRKPGLRLVFDVWADEPVPEPELLRRCRLATAHIAGYSLDAKLRGSLAVCQALGATFGLAVPGTIPSRLQAPPITLRPVRSLADAARTLVAGRYDIREDDRLLREAQSHAGSHAGGAGGAFDALRAAYRERREVNGNTVRLEQTTEAARQAVSALGAHEYFLPG